MTSPGQQLEFSKEAQERLEWLRSRYPAEHQRALILPVLSMAQREFGWVSPEVVHFVASQIPVPPMWVEEVATFYTMYNTRPIGRWHLQVCHNLSCSLMGAEIVIEHIEGKLGIKKGETTPDGEFSLMGAECLGSCGTAPMMQVNDHYHENLTLADVDELLETLRGKADEEVRVEDLPFGPGSGPSRQLPADGRPLLAGTGVHVPHHGESPVTAEVRDRPKESAGPVDTPDFAVTGVAR